MKRSFILLTVLLICAAFVVGCNSQATTTTAPPTSAATSPAATTATTTNAPATATTTTTKPAQTTTQAPASTTSGPKTGGTLRIIIIAGPQNAGGLPWEVFGPDATSYQFVMESFLRSDSKGNVSPWLAESYKVADDLKSITFNLRKGVKFHDGTDFDAAAAKWNLDQQIAAKTQPFWASVDVIDNYTVRVNFVKWSNTNLNTFADGNASWMISPTAFKAKGVDWARNNPVGTGPFKFASFDKDVSYKVVKNPDYWQKGKPYLDGITLLYVADPMTQKATMLSGGADMLEIEPGQASADLTTQGFSYVGGLITCYAPLPDSGHADSPFAKQKVREAVEYAINREAIAKAFAYGFWTAAYQIPAAANGAYNPNFTLGRKFDPVGAKDLLAAAGYPAGFKTTILANPAVPRNIVVAVQSYLASVNIQAEIKFPANMGGFIGDSSGLNNVLVVQPVMSTPNYNSTLTQFLAGPDSFWNHNFVPSDTYTQLRLKSLNAPTYDVNLVRAATDQLTKEAACVPFAEAGLGWIATSYIKDAGWDQRSTVETLTSENVWLNK